jgi:hypothetical protein
MTRSIRLFSFASLALTFLAGWGPVPAQGGELASLMPQQSVLYLEWAGADAVHDAHAATATGKLLAEPEMQRFTAELEKGLNRLMVPTQVPPDLQPVALGLQVGRPLLEHVWHHRVALTVIGTEKTDVGPNIAAALAIEVGPNGAGFTTALQGLIAMATAQIPKQTETIGAYTFQRIDISYFPPIRYGAVDDVFFVTMGADVPQTILAVKGGAAPALAANERFAAARKKLGSTPANTAFTLHLDLAALREQAKPFLQGHTGSEDLPPPVAMALEELGINAVQSFTYTGQFADGGFRLAAFLATPRGGKGLLTLSDGKPLTNEDFYAVPADANFVQVLNLDLGRVFDEALRIVGVFAPEAEAEVTGQFEKMTGMKLREDIIAQFDDNWAFFDAPGRGGQWFTGLTMVAEAKDPDAFLAMLDKSISVIQKAAGEKKVVVVKTYERNGHKIHFATITLGAVPVAPAWGMHGKRVVFGLFPQIVEQALDQMAAPDVEKRCILANPDFARGRKLLPPNAHVVGYTDTRNGLHQVYGLALPALTAGFSFAAANGIPLDISSIPPVDVMTRHLFGDVSGCSRDEDGILGVAHGPLPIPIPAFGAGGGVATSALLMSVWLPSFSRARELSKRQVSQANLAGIGMACMLYAYDHQEQFPPNLKALEENNSISPNQLISPRDPRDPPPDGCTYVYITGQTLKSPPTNVLAYEPEFGNEGGAVVFVDGHTEWIKPPRYQQVIDATRAQVKPK